MKKSMKSVKNIIVIAFMMVVTVIGASSVSAQSTLPLTVAPARQQITVNPGETSSFAVKFYNQSDLSLNGVVKVADFIVNSNDGSPRIVDTADQANPKFSASKWVTLSMDQITIGPQDRTIITASLAVPADARPGGRYITVYFEPSIGTPSTIGTDASSTTGSSHCLPSLDSSKRPHYRECIYLKYVC